MAREMNQNPFWMSIKNNFPSGNTLDEFLKKPNVTVEDLLEADFMVSDYVRSQEAIYFMSKKKNLKKLLEYIIEEPPENATHKRGHKFPFMVHELLNTDHSPFLDLFFSEDEPEQDDHRDEDVDEDDENDEDKDISSTDDNDSVQNDINLLENKFEDVDKLSDSDMNNSQDADQPKDSVESPLKLDHADSLEQYLDEKKDADKNESNVDKTEKSEGKGKYNYAGF